MCVCVKKPTLFHNSPCPQINNLESGATLSFCFDFGDAKCVFKKNKRNLHVMLDGVFVGPLKCRCVMIQIGICNNSEEVNGSECA